MEPAQAPDEAESLLPPPPPGPGTLGALRPPFLNVFLFLLTFASAFLAGSALNDTQLPQPTGGEMWRHGFGFALALLFIMLVHEMGHFVMARRHQVDATWPFFIPAPLLSVIGTLGAVIRLRSLPRTRRALLDVGAWGPIAGFLATIPILVLGLRLSTVVPAEAPSRHWTLFEALLTWFQSGSWPAMREAFDLGQPLGMQLVEKLVVGDLPAGQALALHPVAVAGWFGFLLTALNLLPLGQLDGGHVLYRRGCTGFWARRSRPCSWRWACSPPSPAGSSGAFSWAWEWDSTRGFPSRKSGSTANAGCSWSHRWRCWFSRFRPCPWPCSRGRTAG